MTCENCREEIVGDPVVTFDGVELCLACGHALKGEVDYLRPLPPLPATTLRLVKGN